MSHKTWMGESWDLDKQVRQWRTTKQSQYVNMQGLSIDVEDTRLTRIGPALNIFPPEQIMHANQILWEGLDRNFAFAIPQSNPNYRDCMDSALTTYQYIKIILQRCLEWKQSRITTGRSIGERPQ